jgi:hypothetical protein
MFHPEVPLDPITILNAPGNGEDEILILRQRYWIAEAIRYTHRGAVEALFSNTLPSSAQLPSWPEYPRVLCLPPRKTIHLSLGPLLENEGTIEGTYQVIDQLFLQQFGYKQHSEFDDHLQLVYGDQKTVSLIRTVQKEREEAKLPYEQYSWLLPIPGLFHWRTNYIDMLHNLYSGSENDAIPSTLYHNRNFLGMIQGHKSPFHHKEEVALRAFDARVTALYYQSLPSGVSTAHKEEVDHHIRASGRIGFLRVVDDIRSKIFNPPEQQPDAISSRSSIKRSSVKKSSAKRPSAKESIDYEYAAHAQFLQQMEVYKSLKHAIKCADIGMIKRVFARCCLLFQGSNKTKYTHLSLYMTWLTHTSAADEALQKAILANGLVNLRGKTDSWFEIDRLNEFFNLDMKTMLATRRTSTLNVTALFQSTALTASYCVDLRTHIEAAFGEYTNGRHQAKNASEDVRNLAFEINTSKSIRKYILGRDSDFKPPDILSRGESLLPKGVNRFNKQVVLGQWSEEDDLTNMITTPIAAIEEYVTQDDDIEI